MTARTMTEADCSSKRRTMRQTISVVLAIVTLMAGGVAWAVQAGNSATRKIDVHQARQNGTMERIDAQLTRIEAEQTGQRQLLQKLLTTVTP